MELHNLRTIVEGLDSLAAIEKEHPVLGEKLFSFVNEIERCCSIAYNRFSRALGSVRSLTNESSTRNLEKVSTEIDEAHDSKWFKEVSHVCDRLAALAADYEHELNEQIRYTSPSGEIWNDPSSNRDALRYQAHYNIGTLFSLLQRHERDLKSDIRNAVSSIQIKISNGKSTGNFEDAKKYAAEIQQEISQSIDEINKICQQIKGSSSRGSSIILTPEEVAENALKRPERVLILNMFFLVVVLSLGATVFQYLDIYQFILVSGFAVTAVIVLNAFYLRTIDKLSDESFLKLMQLALLKFFVPIIRRPKGSIIK